MRDYSQRMDWSDLEIKLLELYIERGESDVTIVELLSRTPGSVKQQRLRIVENDPFEFGGYSGWSSEDVEWLIGLYNRDMTYKEIADVMKRSKSSIRQKLWRLRDNGKVGSMRRRRSDVRIDKMIKLRLEGKSNREIADLLDSSVYSIANTFSKFRKRGYDIPVSNHMSLKFHVAN